MKIIQSLLRIHPWQSETILNRRAHLQRRQRQNLQMCGTLTSDPSLLSLPLAELAQRPGEARFGTFVSRCASKHHQQLNFLADMGIQKALDMDRQGIPFTVKDHLLVNDLISTCGYSYNITPAYENAEVVDLLIKAGCVPFAHTNVPQGLLNIESGNNVWGISENPYKQGFISGGSSGGEAAAVATRCSAFGLASDSAGSSRIPAAYCGVVGFKPTGPVRLSLKGRLGAGGQQRYSLKDLQPCMGFITRSVDDLEWVSKSTIGKTMDYNPHVKAPWDEAKYQQYKARKLKFGYIVEDHEMKAVPAVRNCILESVEALRKDGHEVVEFNFNQLYKFRNFIFKIMSATGLVRGINTVLRGEREHKQTWWLNQRSYYGKIGSWVRSKLATTQLEREIYDNFMVGGSYGDIIQICEHKDLIKAEFLKAWAASGIDALITPVTPFTAPLKNSHPYLLNQLTFCGFPNVLEMPSGTLPIRQVTQAETQYSGEGFYESIVANSIKNSRGLPVGVQITAPHMEDQLCVAAMWHLERLFPRIPSPPETWD